MSFNLLNTDAGARAGVLKTVHGEIQTPCFMPVGTQGTVKTLSTKDLKELGAQIVLSNIYHLYLRPGVEIIKQAGGLHKFMAWDGPILTDSGGYQVFSIAELVKVKKDAVYFQSHIDGSKHTLTPEDIIRIQKDFGVDIMMPLDECVAYPAEKDRAKQALDITLDWAKRSKEVFTADLERQTADQMLFGIVQGSTYPDLRRECVNRLADIGFDGYALGGISVGEPQELMYEIVKETASLLPEDRPRYLMGVGTPLDIIEAVRYGVDMFDCVVPTRNGRNGTAFTWQGKLNISNAPYAKDFKPIDERCGCYACKTYMRSYIRHLFNAGEILALRLVSLHNLYFYASFMKELRRSIIDKKFAGFVKSFRTNYNKEV
ncbi:MAG: tRNA guanosine(34) transglycosylase Tgt [Candidatus Omnitrophota bacterium]